MICDIPENNLLDETILQYLFGKRTGRFRTLFTICDRDMMILHIRRGSVNPATAAELRE